MLGCRARCPPHWVPSALLFARLTGGTCGRGGRYRPRRAGHLCEQCARASAHLQQRAHLPQHPLRRLVTRADVPVRLSEHSVHALELQEEGALAWPPTSFWGHRAHHCTRWPRPGGCAQPSGRRNAPRATHCTWPAVASPPRTPTGGSTVRVSLAAGFAVGRIRRRVLTPLGKGLCRAIALHSDDQC